MRHSQPVQCWKKQPGARVLLSVNELSQRLQGFVTGLVHPSVLNDRSAARRHKAFILAHLLAGMAIFAALPVYLLLRGAPGFAETVALIALLLPFGAAFDLSRNGDLGRAHLISACAIAAVILPLALATGGLGSFALPWLLLVPIEAAFGGSRRAIGAASAVAVAVLAILGLAELTGFVPVARPEIVPPGVVSAFGLLSALGYACCLALRGDILSKRAAETNRRGEALYRLLAENMTDLVTRHTRGGNVVYASPASMRLAGADSNQLMGQGLFDRVHIADRPAYLTALSSAALGDGETSVRFRLRTESTAGQAPVYIWVEMRCRALDGDVFSQDGTERQVVAVTRNIEDHVRSESELMAAREEADRASLAKTHFLANISHELRTPLNAIIGFSEILTMDNGAMVDEARRVEYATLIHNSGLHLLSVVNGILDMSRIESGNFSIVAEPFEIGGLIEACTQMLTLKIEAGGLQVSVDAPGDLPYIAGDRRACRQILLNLISNAVKFTPPGGEVKIVARRAGGYVAVSVIDNGIGVAVEDLQRLGEPFFQARAEYDRPYEGTGLGLSIVKGLVRLHDGLFAIESKLGEGTKVTVHLPIQEMSCALPRSGQARPDAGGAVSGGMPIRRSA